MSPRTVFDLLHENGEADVDLLRKCDAEGDVFALARDVDFAFRTEDNGKASALAKFLNDSNYGTAEVRARPGELVWVSVTIHMPITQHVISCVSGFMVCLSRLYKVDFDGWGSMAQLAPSGSEESSSSH